MSPEWMKWLEDNMPALMLEEFKSEWLHVQRWRDACIAKLEAQLQPPTDAEVREAMERVAALKPEYPRPPLPVYDPIVCMDASDRDTLLSFVRAAQAPRQTCDEFVEWCGNCAFGKSEAACDATATGHDDFNGVKCSGWSPRLTGDRLEAVAAADIHLQVHSGVDANRIRKQLRAAFPELREGGVGGWTLSAPCHS